MFGGSGEKNANDGEIHFRLSFRTRQDEILKEVTYHISIMNEPRSRHIDRKLVTPMDQSAYLRPTRFVPKSDNHAWMYARAMKAYGGTHEFSTLADSSSTSDTPRIP